MPYFKFLESFYDNEMFARWVYKMSAAPDNKELVGVIFKLFEEYFPKHLFYLFKVKAGLNDRVGLNLIKTNDKGLPSVVMSRRRIDLDSDLGLVWSSKLLLTDNRTIYFPIITRGDGEIKQIVMLSFGSNFENGESVVVTKEIVEFLKIYSNLYDANNCKECRYKDFVTPYTKSGVMLPISFSDCRECEIKDILPKLFRENDMLFKCENNKYLSLLEAPSISEENIVNRVALDLNKFGLERDSNFSFE